CMCLSSAIVDSCLVFFFQAEDGIRDATVTGVQTCALPICARAAPSLAWTYSIRRGSGRRSNTSAHSSARSAAWARSCRRSGGSRSEERRVGKECRAGGSAEEKKRKSKDGK